MDSALIMFLPLMALIFLGVPVAFALISVALVFSVMEYGGGTVHLFVAKVQEITSSHVLAAAPRQPRRPPRRAQARTRQARVAIGTVSP